MDVQNLCVWYGASIRFNARLEALHGYDHIVRNVLVHASNFFVVFAAALIACVDVRIYCEDSNESDSFFLPFKIVKVKLNEIKYFWQVVTSIKIRNFIFIL
jgi:hypothetical protein